MANLTIETRSDGDVARLILSGEFDLSGITYFQDLLAKVEQGDARTIVVDLSAVEFMDSSGLRALVTGDDRNRAAGRRLVIVAGPPHVRRLFEITQLDERLELVDDDAALGAD